MRDAVTLIALIVFVAAIPEMIGAAFDFVGRRIKRGKLRHGADEDQTPRDS